MLIGITPLQNPNPTFHIQRQPPDTEQPTCSLTPSYPSGVKEQRRAQLTPGQQTLPLKPKLHPKAQFDPSSRRLTGLSKRLQTHSRHLQLSLSQFCSLQTCLPAPKTSPDTLTLTYTHSIKESSQKLNLFTHCLDTCKSIQVSNLTPKSRISSQKSSWIVIQSFLRHLHQFSAFYKTFLTYWLPHLRNASPTRHAYALQRCPSRPTCSLKTRSAGVYSLPAPLFCRATYSFTPTYSHLQTSVHLHLHTYPPFKGGKCNSGARS